MRTRGTLVTILVLIAALTTFYPAHSYAAQGQTGQTGTQEQEVYSNETFVRLVKKYLTDDGEKIDYASWKESP